MANTRSGIIVRIDSVATTKIEAKKLPAAPACSARCEVSIGANQFFLKSSPGTMDTVGPA